MYWEIVPTPQGCQLLVDGVPIGSPAEPPPSGWLQRQYGILMPLEYETARIACRGYAGDSVDAYYQTPEDCMRLNPPFADKPMRLGNCVWPQGGPWIFVPVP